MEHLSFGPALGGVMQVAFVVSDIEREMERFTRAFNVGPFFYLPHFPLLSAQFRGKPTSPDIDVAMAFSGTTCFELVRQRCQTPSPFLETVATRGFGLHHFAVPTRTFDADVAEREKSGLSLLGSAAVALGGRTAFFDAASTLGAMLELIEMTPPVEQIFAMIQAAARDWDGADPVRRLGP
ncbi:MAG TPA: VOC family protein [Polyangiaceae bacterium]|nr:VOC family protein [Polyangiaceae bacterium]